MAWKPKGVALLAAVLTGFIGLASSPDGPRAQTDGDGLSLFERLERVAPEAQAASVAEDTSCPDESRIRTESSSGNSQLSLEAIAHCRRDEIGTRRATPGHQFVMVEGRIGNRSEASAISLPSLTDLLVLQVGAGQAAKPLADLEALLAPDFTGRALQPLDDRAFTALFEVPDGDIVDPVLVIPGAAGTIALPLEPEARIAAPVSAEPVETNGLAVGVVATQRLDRIGDQAASDGHEFVIATLQLQMTQPRRIELGIAGFVTLDVEDDARLPPQPPPNAGGDWFGATQTVFPGVPVTGRLLFLVPEGAGYSLVYGGSRGSIVLASIDGERLGGPAIKEAPAVHATLPEAADLRVLATSVEPALAGESAAAGSAFLIVNLQLGTPSVRHAQTLDLSALVRLSDAKGDIYRPHAVSGSIEKRFTSSTLYAPEASYNGHLVFELPKDRTARSLQVATAGEPLVVPLTGADVDPALVRLGPLTQPHQTSLQHSDNLPVDRVLSINPHGEEINIALAEHLSWQIGGSPALTDGAIDGSDNWQNGHAYWANGHAMTIGFSRPYLVHRLRLGLLSGGDSTTQYVIESSLDGLDWQPLVDHSTGEHGGIEEIAIKPTLVRMLRITGLRRLGGDGFAYLSEIQAFTRDPVPDMRKKISAAEFGGRVIHTPVGPDDPKAPVLIDGYPETYWETSGLTTPEFTLAFHGSRRANINAIVLRAEQYFSDPNYRPGRIEILTSSESPYAGFRRLAHVELVPGAVVHLIPLPQTDVRFIKLRVLENFGGITTRIGDIAVIETPGDRSILDEFLILPEGPTIIDEVVEIPALNADRNIAAIAAGGRAISAYDGETPLEVGSKLNDGAVHYSNQVSFRQPRSEFTFRFFRERIATVSQVNVLNRAYSAPGGPRELVVESSMEADGPYEKIGPTYVLKNLPYRWFIIAFEPRRMRYLRLRILSRHPGAHGGISEIQIIEARQPGESSVLTLDPPEALFKGSRNIAHELLGGTVAASAPSALENWPISNLIDGLTSDATGILTPSFGWTTSPGVEKPVDLVFAFANQDPATIAGLSIDTQVRTSRPGGMNSDFMGHVRNWPSAYEILVSTETRDGPWTKVGRTEEVLQRRGRQAVKFAEPVDARYLAVRLLDNFGGDRLQLGEVEIYETPTACGQSISAALPINLVSPELGGGLVRYEAQDNRDWATHLIDRSFVDSGFGDGIWHSGSQSALPQSLTFAFWRTQAASFDQVEIVSDPGIDPTMRPKRVRVEITTGPNPLEDFESLGAYELEPDKHRHLLALNEPRMARFVRLTVLETFGAPGVALGEVAVRETEICDDYRSVVEIGRRDPVADAHVGSAAQRVTGDMEESEPNDDPRTANRVAMEQSIAGAVSPDSDVDNFVVDSSAAEKSGLRVRLQGDPMIRVELGVQDAFGRDMGTYVSGAAATEKTLRWDVPPGRYNLQVSRPPTSVVLLFDTSGSMDGQIDALREAARQYVLDRAEHEEIALVKFGGSVSVFHDFSTDHASLNQALGAQLNIGGNTALYDGVLQSLDLLKDKRGQKAVILLSDGADTASGAPLDAVWAQLESAGVQMFTIALGQDLKVYGHHTYGAPGIGASTSQMMEFWARATGGKHFFAPGADDLAAVYREASNVLRSEPRYVLTPLLPRPDGYLQVAGAAADGRQPVGAANMVLILDASGSMRGKNAEGIVKMEVAKKVMRSLVNELPDEANVGLRVYGHRLPQKPKAASCQDTELIVPLAPLDRSRLLDQIDALKPRGHTPLGLSIFHLLADFAPVEGRKIAVLVTDGKETCHESPELPFHPARAVKELQSVGVDLLLNIVGFAIAEDQTRAILAEVAGLTGGQYFDADTADELVRSIRQSLALEFVVRNAAADIVARGQVGGGPLALAEGTYSVETDTPTARQLGKINVVSGQTTTLSISE